MNVLHMADGRAYTTADATGDRVAIPAPAFGLGKLRLRRYEGNGFDGTGAWQTTSVEVFTDSVETLELGELPEGVRRLRVTAWWLEVNTGAGEQKAHVALHLVNLDGGGFGGGGFLAETCIEHTLRIDLDEDDPTLPCPTPGRWAIVVQALDVPPQARWPNRENRTVHLAWHWETRADPSRLDCSAASVSTPCAASARATMATNRCESRAEILDRLLGALEGGVAVLGGYTPKPYTLPWPGP